MSGRVVRFTPSGFTIGVTGSTIEYLATPERIIANPERLKVGAECTFEVGRMIWPGEYAVANYVEL
jgi:hypothetical protein